MGCIYHPRFLAGEFTSGQWCDDGPGWVDYPQAACRVGDNVELQCFDRNLG